MATCSFYREIVLSVCLQIRRDPAKCMFSSFTVFRITNGAFSGLLRFIALCRDRQYAQRCSQVNNFGRDPWMFQYEACFVSLPIISFQCPAVVGSYTCLIASSKLMSGLTTTERLQETGSEPVRPPITVLTWIVKLKITTAMLNFKSY